jgi:hypothetical protein
MPVRPPWHWYCRLCGAEGDSFDSDKRDAAAHDHVRECRPVFLDIRTASYGRTLHIWAIAVPVVTDERPVPKVRLSNDWLNPRTP